MPSTIRIAVLFLLLCSSSNLVVTSGFYVRQQQPQKTTITLTQFHVVSFNDFSGETIGDATSDEGQELAQEFYDQLRRREEEEQEKRRQLERLERALKNGHIGLPRRPTGMQQQQQQVPRVRQDVLDFEKEFRKWTGQTEDEQVTTSAGFFRGGSSVYSYPASAAGRGIPTAGGAQTMEDDNTIERAVLNVLPYVLALAVVLSLAMGSGAFEASSEYDLFHDSTGSTNNVATSSMSATSPFATAETTLQQHMDQMLLRNNNFVML
jgi:polyhydroxyalkanoate synthesis regulator phasin